jgi:hypothetical protein
LPFVVLAGEAAFAASATEAAIDLTKALRLAAALEDEKIARKLELRK